MRLNQLIYQVTRPLGGLQLARYLSRNHPKILMYHRISMDGNSEGISAEQFRRQVEIIKKYFFPMTLKDLMRAHETGKVPEHAVVVTFDDGYSDFADIAFPILEEADVPATLFVTTGFINGDLWLWPDQLRYAVEKSNKDCLEISGVNYKLDSNEERIRTWHLLADLCLTVENEEKISLIRKVFDGLEVVKPIDAPDKYKSLSWDQINEMVDKGLDVGSHTVSHPVLTKMDLDLVDAEITESRDIIKDKLGLSVESFCYPNGLVSDYDETVKIILKKRQYKYAVTAFPKSDPLDNKWEVGRYPVSQDNVLFEKVVFGLTYIGMRRK